MQWQIMIAILIAIIAVAVGLFLLTQITRAIVNI